MSEDSTKQTDEKSGGTRSKVLFAILALGLVALAYDYRVARPAVEVAYNKIAERSTAVNARSTEVFTNLDVRELLGKEPSRTFDDSNGDVVEVFSWRSGLPIKTHDLFAVYKPNGGKNLFYRHAKYKYEASGDVSTISVTTTIENVTDAADFAEAAYESETGSGDGGGQAAGGDDGGGGRGGGGGWDPEAMFAENDEDGDGILKGEEISDRMRENLAEIDTDGDGGVSKDEMMARFAARRGGGGRPGGGGGDGGRRSRPESEDAEPTAETDSAAAYQAAIKAKAETEAEPEAKAETEAKTEAEAEPEAKAETEAEPEAKAETEAEPEAELKAETKSEGDEA